jgi:hypothetical protein
VLLVTHAVLLFGMGCCSPLHSCLGCKVRQWDLLSSTVRGWSVLIVAGSVFVSRFKIQGYNNQRSGRNKQKKEFRDISEMEKIAIVGSVDLADQDVHDKDDEKKETDEF